MIFLQILKFSAFKSRLDVVVIVSVSDEIPVKASKRKALFCLRVSVGGGRAKQSEVAHLLLVRKQRQRASRTRYSFALQKTGCFGITNFLSKFIYLKLYVFYLDECV